MNLSDVITAAILSKEIGIANTTAKSILEEAGEGIRLGNSTLYSREAVRNVLIERNRPLLTFLNYEGLQQAPVASEENADA